MERELSGSEARIWCENDVRIVMPPFSLSLSLASSLPPTYFRHPTTLFKEIEFKSRGRLGLMTWLGQAVALVVMVDGWTMTVVGFYTSCYIENLLNCHFFFFLSQKNDSAFSFSFSFYFGFGFLLFSYRTSLIKSLSVSFLSFFPQPAHSDVFFWCFFFFFCLLIIISYYSFE